VCLCLSAYGRPLVAHLAEIHKVHDADRALGLSGVYMPGSLDKKMPKAGAAGSGFGSFRWRAYRRTHVAQQMR
jgi:hypothetical protein